MGVTVSDTLRPVITLRYKGAKVAQGTRDATGDETADSKHHGTLNTKHVADPNGLNKDVADTEFPDTHTLPTLMAEETTSSVNGWVLGAIASARRPCPVGLQHAPHRGRHQRAGLSAIYTTYALVSRRGTGLRSCVIFAWTLLLT